jgi:hypothetical protein
MWHMYFNLEDYKDHHEHNTLGQVRETGPSKEQTQVMSNEKGI